MASNRDIRTWATSHGLDLKEKGRLPESVKRQYREAMGLPEPPPPAEAVPEDPTTAPAPSSEPAADPPPPPPSSSRPTEKPPVVKGGGWFSRRKEQRSRRKPVKGRESTERLISGVWGLTARLLGGFGQVPLARVLEMQAPVAGALLEPAVAGAALDPFLQPFAAMANKGSVVWSMIGLPLMVQLVSMRPELYGAMEDLMIDAIWSWLEVAEPELKQKMAELERRRERFGDPKLILRTIFAPPGEPTVVDADAAA